MVCKEPWPRAQQPSAGSGTGSPPGGIDPPALPKGAAAWPRFMRWAVEYVKVLAGCTPTGTTVAAAGGDTGRHLGEAGGVLPGL
jgi:hypothetical protein